MYELVVVGTSWGGLRALTTIIACLPGDFILPIAVVQHRRKDADESLVTILDAEGRIPVREAEDKEEIEGGYVYIAPPDYHLLIEPGTFALSTDAPVAYSRPSIDVMFETAADAYGSRVIGVVLTGSNADGTLGLQRIKARGGYTIVQDPETAESRTMPEAAIAAVSVDRVVPLDKIAGCLVELSRLSLSRL